MADSARDHLAQLLAAHDELPASVQLRPRPPGAVQLHVDGLGEVALPVSAAQARALRDLGQPARFGRGEQTLTDTAVRDTWEVPRDAVQVDWAPAADLTGALESVRDNLGLPDGCRLTAELHSLLVYETGQFFLPHQDSEKSDAMVATLVVTLPSRHSGGELVVHHLGEATSYHGSPSEVSLVAFYADCRHEVRPVTSGHRVTLTYNLMVTGAPLDRVPDDVVLGHAADHLRAHFRTPVRRRYGTDTVAPPRRLVFLLDHEYTERGLAWDRLKGTDTSRAALLRAGAEVADCEAVLALAEVEETWDAQDPDEYDHYDRRRSSWRHTIDEDEADDDAGPDDSRYVLNSLIDSNVRLTRWTDAAGTSAEDISLDISEDEVCAVTPTSTLKPYQSQYEGYMGNYGNTLDRWYRRAAVVVAPRDLGFAQRAEASPGWALRDLAGRADDPAAVHRDATTLAPFWDAAVRTLGQPDQLLTTAFVVAELVDDPELAATLLRPFAIEALAAGHAPALATLTGRYGEPWTTALLTGWRTTRPMSMSLSMSMQMTPGRRSRRGWLGTLPDLVAALAQSAGPGGAAADILADVGRQALCQLLDDALRDLTPSGRAAALTRLGPALTAVITAAGSTGAPGPLDALVQYCRTDGDRLEPCLRAALLTGSPEAIPATARTGSRTAAALARLATDQVHRIRARLAVPPRDPADWSMALPPGCACDLCATLGAFLAAPARQTFDWPLAKDRRSHVHSRIDRAELPVRHLTRRTGRPFTLVLTKTPQLFEAESSRRAQDSTDLAALTERWPSAGTPA